MTRGDVEAQFQAVETGGAVIRANKGFETTIPPAQGLKHSIRPILPFFDDLHYCTLDWHLISWAFGGTPEFWGLSTRNEFKNFLLGTEVTFLLDDVETPAQETTAVKSNLDASRSLLPGKSSWRAWGNFYPPGDLPVGTHTLTGEAAFPGGFSFPLDLITFHIDPDGSGACL